MPVPLPLQRVAFLKDILPFAADTPKRAAELATVSESWDDTIENYTKDMWLSLQDKNPRTWEQAVKAGNIIAVRSMLKAGFDIDAELWVATRTALHHAIFYNQEKMVMFLIQSGANLSLPNLQGNSPLQEASELGRTDIARALLEAGADVNQQKANGNTALHVAVLSNNTALVRLLMEFDANQDVIGIEGHTALSLAKLGKQNDEIIKILKQFRL